MLRSHMCYCKLWVLLWQMGWLNYNRISSVGGKVQFLLQAVLFVTVIGAGTLDNKQPFCRIFLGCAGHSAVQFLTVITA